MRKFKLSRIRPSVRTGLFKKPEFIAALYASLIAFAINPITQLISYKLNDHWSRPILTIEYVFVHKPATITNIKTIQEYFKQSKLYEQYLSKNILSTKFNFQTILNDIKGISQNALFEDIKNELDNFHHFLEGEKKGLEKEIKQTKNLSPSELRISLLMNADNPENEGGRKDSKNTLVDQLVLKIQEIDQALEDMLKIKKEMRLLVSSTQFKVSVLNKGSTDGLIRNEGSLIIGDSVYAIYRIEPPVSAKILEAVPTYNINYMDYETESVGRVERKTMIELWFQVDRIGDLELQENAKVILRDQNNNKISNQIIRK